MFFKRSTFFTVSLLFTLLFNPAHAQPLPDCRYDSLSTPYTDYHDWQRTLLDPIYKLDESYVPPDLEAVAAANVTTDKQLRELVLGDLTALLEGAAANGTPLELQSAYRSYAYQAATFQYWVEQEGEAAALKSSARAGHSEHQLGTAVDFRSAGGPAPWDVTDWAQTPAGAWLAANAWRYGFVMSYPRGAEDTTCYVYEPWHYRYLGRDGAKVLRESGLSLREWLWQQQ